MISVVLQQQILQLVNFYIAFYCYLYCFSNIFTGINNNLYYSFNGTSYVLTFPAGLYSLDNINETISIQTLLNNDNANLINIQGNNATSSV